MIFKLSKKIFGTKNILTLSEFATDNPIEDICWAGNSLVFSHGNILGKFDLATNCSAPWKGVRDEEKLRNGTNPSFGKLSSLSYYAKNPRIFVVENGGRDVRCIDLRNEYTTSMIVKQNTQAISGLLRKFDVQEKAYVCATGEDSFLILFSCLRKCFLFSDSSLWHIAGDGKCRFGVSDSPQNCSIGLPSGITAKDKKVFLADSQNNVIRVLDNRRLTLYCGHPLQDVLSNPGKVIVSGNLLYVLGKGVIYCFAIDKKIEKVNPIYQSDTICNMAANDRGELFILENEHA